MPTGKKPKQEVTIYGMSIHFGICTGPVEYMWGLIVDEKDARDPTWPKHLTGPQDQPLFLPDLFGGEKKEGGLGGMITWLPGRANQVMPEVLATKFGRTSATMVGYRGIASLFFWGVPGFALPGFYWRANTPFLPGVWVGVARASEALEIPHARIFRIRTSMRPSIFIALPMVSAGTPEDATRLATIITATNTVLDRIAEAIATGMDVDIRLVTYGLNAVSTTNFHATAANIAGLKSYVSGLTMDKADNNFELVADSAQYWFNFTAPGGPSPDASINRRIFILITAYYPTEWIVGTPPGSLAASAASMMSDLLSRTGGTFNTAAGTAVDCYGINLDLADTQYTAYLDNTFKDGIPIIAGDDPDALASAMLHTLGGDVYDSNPAHIIYESLTNPNWGMGSPASAIDVAGFTAASVTLYAERFGLSMMWTQQSSIEDFISEVLDHIQATLFVDPRTGLLTLKLIRNDYSVPSLPVFTPDNSVVTNFSRKLWGETINEIVVTWTNPENEEEETVVAQDLANIEAQGGVISDSRNYYGVRRPDLAARLAHRDLRSASTPLAKCDLEVNRAAWDLLPGDCCVLDSPEDGIDLIVMRVGPVDYGKPGDSTVRISLVEDVFSLALADYTDPPESLWVDTSEYPSPADHTKIVTLPYYLVTNLIDASIVAGVGYPEVFAGVLAAEAGQDTNSFELLGQETNAAGALVYANFGTKSITSRATLAATIAAETETVILSFPDRTQGNGPVVGGLMLIEGADETTSEICLVSDVGVGGYTFVRGVLDTVPRAWPIGTPVWFVDDNMAFVDEVEIRSEGETVHYKVLPTTSLGTLAASAAPVSSAVMTARPHLPLRPADVMVNSDAGFAITAIDCVGVDPIPVTWARRNRETETAIIKAWDDGDVTPEAGQTTTITLTDIDGAVLHIYSGVVGTSFDVVAADFAGEAAGYVVVSSERDGLSSLQAWRALVQITVPTPITVPVTGVSATVSVGTVTVIEGAGSTATVTGVSATVSVGTVTVTATAVWTPAALGSTLRAWLQADTIGGANGSAIATWSDSSGVGNSVTQATSGNRPTLATVVLNGKDVVRFNGTTQFLDSTHFLNGETAGASFVVFKRNADPPAAAGQAGPIVTGFTSDSAMTHMPWTDGTIYDNFGTSSRKTVGNPTPSMTSWRIYSAHSGASDWRAYFDGTSLFTTATNTFGTGNTTYVANPQIGRGFAGTTTHFFDGDLAEVIITNAVLTTSQRQKVEGYIAHKWGLTANLASGHPYKTTPPVIAQSWNPSDIANCTLSGGDLTAAATSGTAGVRAISGHSSGKYYWEATLTLFGGGGSGTEIGVATASATLAGDGIAGQAVLTNAKTAPGTIWVNGSNSGSALGILNTGDVIGIAIDLTAQLIWFRKAPSGNWNGSGTANPATGTGGLGISALSGSLFPFFGATFSGDGATANFGASAFSGTVPSGFTSGWPL